MWSRKKLLSESVGNFQWTEAKMLSEDKKVRDDEEIGVNDGAVIEMKDHRRSVKLKYVILLIIAIALM